MDEQAYEIAHQLPTKLEKIESQADRDTLIWMHGFLTGLVNRIQSRIPEVCPGASKSSEDTGAVLRAKAQRGRSKGTMKQHLLGASQPMRISPSPRIGGHMLDVSSEGEAATDAELVDQARAGDRDAFGQLINRHYQTCIRAASFMLRDRVDAQDEVQVACWKAFQHLDQYRGLAQFSSWLIHIVVNECLTLMRSRRQTRFVYLDGGRETGSVGPRELVDYSADPESQAVNNELVNVLKREIRRSPPLFRTILVMRDIQELPMPKVADQLGITVPAAKSRLLRARIELKQRVMRYCGHSGRPALTAERLPQTPGTAVPL